MTARSARQLAILTCMDARLDPGKHAGLAEGDAHVIRDAGGRASDDAIRSHPLVPDRIDIHGFVNDVTSARLVEVPAAAEVGAARSPRDVRLNGCSWWRSDGAGRHDPAALLALAVLGTGRSSSPPPA